MELETKVSDACRQQVDLLTAVADLGGVQRVHANPPFGFFNYSLLVSHHNLKSALLWKCVTHYMEHDCVLFRG